MASKVQTLAPTDGIKDPQVRSFCESLSNAWQLRNGNTGFDDKERFITKQEWDFLAKNPNIRALAGVGQEGASINQPGEPGTGTAAVGSGGAFVVPAWIQNLVDFLQSGITLIDFDAFRQAQGNMWTTIYRLTSQMGDSESGLSLEITARTSSDTALATQLNKLWAHVGNANPANALVLMGATVTANPIAGAALIFNQVQAAVTGANGQIYQAAGKTEFTAYANANEARATASWSLKVQAQGPAGKYAASGMIVYAGINPNDPHSPVPGAQSAIVFNTDTFLVTHSSIPNVQQAPFVVSGGVVRINVLYISDYIRSDVFFDAGQGGFRDGFGWAINKNGDASFYGIVMLGKLMSGSVLIDRNSKQEMFTTATGSWYSSVTPATAAKQTNPNLDFYGPNLHTSTQDRSKRVRVTVPGEGGNGVPLVTRVEFSGVADHFVTLWRSYDGVNWEPLNTSVEPGTGNGGYGSTNCVWAGLTDVGIGSHIRFAVSSTDANGNPFGGLGAPTLFRDFAVTITMVNI
jgi:hypothetical protein